MKHSRSSLSCPALLAKGRRSMISTSQPSHIIPPSLKLDRAAVCLSWGPTSRQASHLAGPVQEALSLLGGTVQHRHGEIPWLLSCFFTSFWHRTGTFSGPYPCLGAWSGDSGRHLFPAASHLRSKWGYRRGFTVWCSCRDAHVFCFFLEPKLVPPAFHPLLFWFRFPFSTFPDLHIFQS